MTRTLLAALAATVLITTGAAAHDFTLGGITVGHPMTFETPVTVRTGGGYLTITNTGDAPDRLIGIEADFPRVELHETVETDGVNRMIPVEAVELAPGETVAFAPGGKHVMFMGLDGDPFEVGEEIPATLIFETAGRLDVVFEVEARDGGDAHGAMDHGASGEGAEAPGPGDDTHGEGDK